MNEAESVDFVVAHKHVSHCLLSLVKDKKGISYAAS
jgi:hypothetical protein